MSQDDRSSLPTSVEALQQMVLRMQQEVATAQQEVATAQQEVIQQKQVNVELSATVKSQTERLAKNERTIRELIAALKGKTRERVDPDQLLLFELGELEALIEEAAAESNDKEQAANSAPKKKKRGHGRRIIPDNLPREEVIYELPEDERRCPVDGKPMSVIRYEISEQLEFEPAKLKVIVHKRAVYACPDKHDEATLITAPKPPQPIEKGLAGPGLLSEMVVGKFGDHLPAYRLEDILQRHGADFGVPPSATGWRRSPIC